MSVSQTPFYTVKIDCPICGAQNEYKALKAGACAESGHDTDFCPTDRIWADRAYQDFNPLLFSFVTCCKCYYTRELSTSFKEWASDPVFRDHHLDVVRNRHLEALGRDRGIVKIMGDHIDQDARPFESAVLKILLAIFDGQIAENPSNLDIARFFLRIGWLFREHDGDRDSQAPAAAYFEKIAAEINRLNSGAREFRSKYTPVKKAIEYSLDAMAVDCQNSGLPQQIKGCAVQIEHTLGDFETQLADIQARLGSAMERIGEARSAAGSHDRFGHFANFRSYLNLLRGLWDEVPLCETDALKKSREYYVRSCSAGREIKRGLQQLQAIYLIAELSRRIGDQAAAQEHFRIAIREARDLLARHRADNIIVANARKILEMATELVVRRKPVSEVSA